MSVLYIIAFERNAKVVRRIIICECDKCGKYYAKKYRKQWLDRQDLTFCKRSCWELSRRKGGKANRKYEQTCLDKYGVTHPHKLKITQDKIRKTSQIKYGVDHPLSLRSTREKIKKSSLKKYGKEYACQSENVKEKMKNTCQQRYGTSCSLQAPQIKERIRQTLLLKYGVDNPLKSKEIRKKRADTMKKNQTPGKSKIEDEFYEFLLLLFDTIDVLHHVQINHWTVDFYVKPIDTYIQLDGVYWHGLDRSIEIIKEFRNPRDRTIYGTYLRDQEQNKWFDQTNKRLVRITDREFKELRKTNESIQQLHRRILRSD